MSDYDIGAAFEAIEDEITASMMRNLSRHRAEETATGINWSQWQVEQLKALEDFKARNAKKYPEQFKDINDRIPDIINAQREAGQADQEVEILEAMKQGHKPPAQKMKTAKQVKMDAQFFSTNDRKMNALIKATTDDMKKAETSILRRANDQYRKIIYNAQVYANSGAGTYAKAVDMATKDFLSAGINSIEYANGSRHTVSDYADMAIRTASKRAYLTGEGEKRKEMGEHLVIMNKRGAPCPKCLPFVGKVMIDDVWSGGSREDGNYPLMSTAISAGLYHPRCQDSHSTYFAGITKVDGAYTQKELNDIEEENKQEAREQYALRQEKKYERLAKHSLDDENAVRYEAKREEWKDISLDFMSNSFRPKYGNSTYLKIGELKLDVKPVKNSQFDMVTDTKNTVKNKAVRLAEKNLRKIKKDLPDNFEIPKVAVVDFAKINPNAIGGYQKNLNILFINSAFDTKDKIIEYVNRYSEEFANTTELAPYLHELGHKFYEDCIKSIAMLQKITYNKAKRVVDELIYSYVESNTSENASLKDLLSNYAERGYNDYRYTEVVAESFAVQKDNKIAADIIQSLAEEARQV